MILTSAIATLLISRSTVVPPVELGRVPNRGIQPQIVQDSAGTTHLLYYSGDARNGNLYYVRSKDDGASWSKPVRVNHEPDNAIAMGTIRGGQLAVAEGRVHVVWNGSKGRPAQGMHAEMARRHGVEVNEMPLLYTRSTPAGGFEKEKNLLGNTKSLDGGASVAAGKDGKVYVVWHALKGDATADRDRQVWIARSDNAGKSFSTEKPVWAKQTGACGCCGLKAMVNDGTLWVSYRAATKDVDRDSYLLKSNDGGKSFQGDLVSRWNVTTCPMSSYWLQSAGKGTLLGAEEQGNVLWVLPSGKLIRPAIKANPAKYPTASTLREGTTLAVWTEGMGWDRGGDVVWQGLDPRGNAIPGLQGRRSGVPPWSFAAVIPTRTGFRIVY